MYCFKIIKPEQGTLTVQKLDLFLSTAINPLQSFWIIANNGTCLFERINKQSSERFDP